MGSINQTCAISRTLIAGGEAAVLVVLARDPRFNRESFDLAGHVGRSHGWRPVSLPILGTCGEYGRLADWEEGTALEISQAAMGIELADLMDPDARRDFTLGNEEGAPPLSALYVNADLFARLTDGTTDNIGTPVEGGTERVKHARFVEVAAAMSRRSTLAQMMPSAIDKLPLNAIGGVKSAWERETGERWRDAPYVSRFFGTSWHNQHPALTQAVTRALEAGYRAGHDGADVLDRVLAYQFLDDNMARLGREWLPSLTTGHDPETAIHRELAAWTAARCDALDRDPEEDWEAGAPAGP